MYKFGNTDYMLMRLLTQIRNVSLNMVVAPYMDDNWNNLITKFHPFSLKINLTLAMGNQTNKTHHTSNAPLQGKYKGNVSFKLKHNRKYRLYYQNTNDRISKEKI